MKHLQGLLTNYSGDDTAKYAYHFVIYNKSDHFTGIP